MNEIKGYCKICGSPIYQYQGVWGSITPPPFMFTCSCYQSSTTTNTEFKSLDFDSHEDYEALQSNYREDQRLIEELRIENKKLQEEIERLKSIIEKDNPFFNKTHEELKDAFAHAAQCRDWETCAKIAEENERREQEDK